MSELSPFQKGALLTAATLTLLGGAESNAPRLPQEGFSRAGICAVGATVELQSQDCMLLPALPKDTRSAQENRVLGSMVLGWNGPYFENSKLPPNYTEAFLQGMTPYTLYAWDKIGTDISIEGAEESDGAMFGSMGDAPHVSFWFNQTGDPSVSRFATNGDIRATLAHEFSHGIMRLWGENPDPKTQGLLRELDARYAEELTYQAEQLRIQKGPEIAAKLKAYRAVLNPDQHADILEAIDHTIERLGVSGGATELVVHTGTGDSSQIRFDTIGKVLKNGKVTLNPFYRQPAGLDMSAYKDAEKIYNDFFSETYADVHETHILGGMVGDMGHAYANASETMASLVTTVHIHPLGLVDSLRAMVPERRERILEQLKIIRSLYEINDPKALPYLPFDLVIGLGSPPNTRESIVRF
jgi:hypothetical protein